MPGLKFLIEGDDRKLRKTLKDLARDMDKDLTSAAGGLAVEIDKSNKKTTEAIRLVEKEERAYKKRNTEAAKLPVQKRKVDMGNSAAEVAAYKTGQVGNIASGSVAGHHAALGAQANAATAASVAQTKLATETVKTTVANKAQSLSIEEMRAKLLSLKEAQLLTTNPTQRAKYNQQIQQTTLEIGRMENAGKKGFDAMGNAVKNTGNGIQRAIQGLFRMAYLLPGIGVAGLLAFAIDPIVSYIGQLDLFSKKITEAIKAKKELVQVQLDGAKSAQQEVVTANLLFKQYQNSNLPLQRRKEAYLELQRLYPAYFGNLKFETEAAGRTEAAYNKLKTSIIATARARAASDKISQNESRKLDNETAIRELEIQRDKELANAKKVLRNASNQGAAGAADIAGRSEKRAEEAQKKINDLKTDSNILTKRNLDLEKLVNQEVEKGGKVSGNVGGTDTTKAATTAESQYQSALAKRLDLINSINAASEEATAKGLIEEDNELAQSEAKYKKMREDVVEFNKWVDNYNKTHLKKIQKVGTDQIDIAEENDRDAILDKQRQKQYDHYKELRDSLLNHTQQIERIQKEHQDKLAELAGEQGGKVTPEQASELQKQTDAKINAIKDEAFQTSAIYKQLNEDISYYTKEQLKIQIASIEEFLKGASGIPPELRERLAGQLETAKGNLGKSGDDAYISGLQKRKTLIQQALATEKLSSNELEKQLEDLKDINAQLSAASKIRFTKAADGLRSISGMASELSGAFSGVNSQISETLGKVSELANIGGSAIGASTSFLSGDILGGITQSISAIGGIIKLFDKSQARAETAAYYQQVYTGEKEYARMMRARQAIQENITELTIRELDARKNMLSGQSGDAKKDFDETLSRIRQQGSEAKRVRSELDSTWSFLGSKRQREIEDAMKLDTSSFDELERLFTSGQMSESAKGLFQELKKSKEEMEALGQQGIETEEILQKIRTGTTASDLSSTLLDMFKNGKTGVQDFADFFQNTIQDAIFSTFKNDVLNKEMDDWYKEFDKLAKDGTIDTADQTALQSKLAEIDAKGKAWLDNMQAATGVNLSGKGVGSPNGLQGAIRREMTESTASELTGLFRGQYDVTKRLLTATSDGFAKSHDIAMGGIRHLQAIEMNTANTVSRLDVVVNRLDMVIANTKQVVTGKGLGLP